MTLNSRNRSAALLGGVALVAVALAGCSSSSDPATSSSPAASTGAASSSGGITKDDALAAMVPADLVSAGKVIVGTDSTYPPAEFLDTDNETIIGFDVELGEAIGEVLGIPFEFQTAPFDSIITGLGSDYDVGMSSFTINPERLKETNMVSYFEAGTLWATAAGNPSGITPDSACGMKVAVQKATVQAEDIAARSEECTKAGDQAITIDTYAAQTDATNAVVAGKDDAMLADSTAVAYAVTETGGKLEIVGDLYDAAPYGVVVPKAETEFADAIAGAIQVLIDGGQYEAILTEWGVQDGAIATSEVNPSVG